jgi:hypothetical protein
MRGAGGAHHQHTQGNSKDELGGVLEVEGADRELGQSRRRAGAGREVLAQRGGGGDAQLKHKAHNLLNLDCTLSPQVSKSKCYCVWNVETYLSPQVSKSKCSVTV